MKMNINRWLYLGMLILAFLENCESQSPKLDLKGPLDRISEKVNGGVYKFDLKKTIIAIFQTVADCLPTGGAEVGHQANDQNNFLAPLLLALKTYLETLPLSVTRSLEGLRDFSEFCKTPEFAEIHNFVWVHDEDRQLEDMVEFFHMVDSSYDSIYDNIKTYYETNKCPDELIATLPKKPDPSSRITKTSQTPSNIRERMIHSEQSMVVVPLKNENCTLVKIGQRFIAAGVLNLVGVIDQVVQEFGTQAGMQFLVGKIQEPIKGRSIRQLRLLPSVRKLFHEAHTKIIADEVYCVILQLVRDNVGIDLIRVNILETVLSLVELILWQNVTPVPPPFPNPEYVC